MPAIFWVDPDVAVEPDGVVEAGDSAPGRLELAPPRPRADRTGYPSGNDRTSEIVIKLAIFIGVDSGSLRLRLSAVGTPFF